MCCSNLIMAVYSFSIITPLQHLSLDFCHVCMYVCMYVHGLHGCSSLPMQTILDAYIRLCTVIIIICLGFAFASYR